MKLKNGYLVATFILLFCLSLSSANIVEQITGFVLGLLAPKLPKFGDRFENATILWPRWPRPDEGGQNEASGQNEMGDQNGQNNAFCATLQGSTCKFDNDQQWAKIDGDSTCESKELHSVTFDAAQNYTKFALSDPEMR